MKISSVAFALALAVGGVESFQTSSTSSVPSSRTTRSRLYEYVPSGFTPEQYKKFKADEVKKKKSNLGQMGPKGMYSKRNFCSRKNIKRNS